MNGLFMTQSLKKKRKLEEGKTDEYYAFSEDSEDDDILNVVVGHGVSYIFFADSHRCTKQLIVLDNSIF